ncbi:MAG: hypothetical protein DDT23_00372 [candidate division WS2 bacterium]|nr:hypothetical protein [Candidatus Lithacetigena glycinireducens]
MSKYYTLEEVRSIRNEISKLGERKFDELEAERDKARAEWDKAAVEWEKVFIRWGKQLHSQVLIIQPLVERDKAEWSKAVAGWNKARAELDKARAKWDMKLFKILVSILPEGHYRDWLGYLTIPKDEDEEWIIPIFTGAYREIKHTAFSIWTIPKESCDEKLAKEVKEDE